MELNDANEKKKKEFSEQFNKLLSEFGYKIQISLDFPEYKVLPEDIKLALLVLNKHKNQFLLDFIEEERKEI
jgi:hypothetical protein